MDFYYKILQQKLGMQKRWSPFYWLQASRRSRYVLMWATLPYEDT